MTSWFRALFLFSSFGPLYAVLALGLYVQNHCVGASVAVAAFVLSFLVFLKLRSGFKKNSVFHAKVQTESMLDENILTYMITYIPPFLIDDFSKPEKFIPALGFYVVMVALMLRTETIYVNPYFLWFGYRIYRVTLESGRPAIIVTRRDEVVSGDLLNLYEVHASRLYFAD